MQYPTTAAEGEWDAAAAAFDAKSSYAAGSIEGWVFDAEAMLAYATVRRFLRTLQWREFTNLDRAAEELFGGCPARRGTS
jgi:hypothetical protein